MIDDRPSRYQSVEVLGHHFPGTHDTQEIWKKAALPTDLKGMSFLDVGCATGAYLIEAIRAGASVVTGIDEAADCCTWASKTLLSMTPKQMALVRVEVGQYPERCPPPGVHDIVIALSVIHHCEYPLRFLRALREDTHVAAWVEWELWDESLNGKRIDCITENPLPTIPGVHWGRGSYPTREAAMEAMRASGFHEITRMGRVRATDCGLHREVFRCG